MEIQEVVENIVAGQAIMKPDKIVSPYKQRFSEAPWFDLLRKKEVLILGQGGTGSWISLCLARAGVEAIYMYDMDTVEGYNLAGQLYSIKSIGKNKAEAMALLCREFAGGETKIHTQREYTADCPSGEIVISAFDNMKSRKLAFDKWAALMEASDNKDDFIFIDPRMLMEDYQVYAVTKDRLDMYRATLFEDSAVEAEPCSMKSTTHCSMGVACDVMSLLTNFIANRAYVLDGGIEERNVPFSVTKSVPLFMYDIKR